jgi:branched-chain amino acid transport system ATP-binding protein
MADLLSLSGVSAGYGTTVVIEDIDLAIREGETLAVIGRNGVGKTTLLATIMGRTTLHGGSIRFKNAAIATEPIWARARSGLGLVPQEREIFPSLSVQENLAVARRAGGWSIEKVFALFPGLARRRANRGNQLSGGEQQMLAIGRALMAAPRLLLLDEPLEGLAPVVADAVLDALRSLRDETGMTLVLVEQHVSLALDFAPRAIAIDRGRIAYEGASAALAADEARLAGLVSVADLNHLDVSPSHPSNRSD